MTTTRAKIGFVLLKGGADGRFTVAWRDPASRKYLRRLLPASSPDEAREQAHEINRHLAMQRGFTPTMRGGDGSAGPTISEAALEAIRNSEGRERTKRDYLSRFNGFLDFMAARYPQFTHWNQVHEGVLDDYQKHCRGKLGLAADSVRLRLYVLRLTSKYMARAYSGLYRDVAASMRLRRDDRYTPQKVVLDPDQMRGLLAWLKDHDRRVYVWAALQGLAGLRVLEAAYLRRGDVDLAAGAVTIAESTAHRPKTRSSFRTIPLARAALAALAETIGDQANGRPEEWIFPPQRQRAGRSGAKLPEVRAGALSLDRVRRLWQKALSAARVAGVDLPEGFQPHRLRASFITAVRKAGADLEVTQRYVGHTPTSVTGRHYDQVDLERLRSVARLAEATFGDCTG